MIDVEVKIHTGNEPPADWVVETSITSREPKRGDKFPDGTVQITDTLPKGTAIYCAQGGFITIAPDQEPIFWPFDLNIEPRRVTLTTTP